MALLVDYRKMLCVERMQRTCIDVYVESRVEIFTLNRERGSCPISRSRWSRASAGRLRL